MESALRYVLKSYFEEYVDGLDKRIDCRSFPVILKGLQIKDERLREDMEDSAFEFTDGVMGRVELQMSWMGALEVVVSDLRLSFSFSPMKAMKKALMPEEDPDAAWRDMQNQAPYNQGWARGGAGPGYPVAPGFPPGAPVPPRYCSEHDTSEKRPKREPRFFDCESCRTTVQTTYVNARFCPVCSERERRCMCCGAHAPRPGYEGPAPWGQDPWNGARGPNAPVSGGGGAFCRRHALSETREKVEMHTVQCRRCQLTKTTKYREFALCSACSQQDCRCMICGTQALPQALPSPPPQWAPLGDFGGPLLPDGSLPPPLPEGFRRIPMANTGGPPRRPEGECWPLQTELCETGEQGQGLCDAPQEQPRLPYQRSSSPGLRRRGGSVERAPGPRAKEAHRALPPQGAGDGRGLGVFQDRDPKPGGAPRRAGG